MKKLLGLVILFQVAGWVHAQELRTKTSDVFVNVKTPRSRTTVPSIDWVTPRTEWSNNLENELEIEANVTSDVPLQGVSIQLGDQATGSSRSGKSLEIPANALSYKVKQRVYLQEGSNYVEIIAENINGGKVSSTRNVTTGAEAISAVSSDRKDYALLFATDNYDYWTDLVNPIYDASTMATELRDKYGFEVEVVENANQEDVLVKIKDYAKRNYKPQDQLFIFFAGHGQFDEVFGEGYVVARNSLEADKAKTTYISHSNLRSYINNINCSHILLTMDVCFGGALDPAIARSRGNAPDELTTNEFLARKLSRKTRRYITSGGKEYVSDGVVGKHSPFAMRFIEALKSRGGEDGILTISEIVPFLEKIRDHEPRSGEFGDNESGSDFVFVTRR